jgi:hypothetical protein
MPNLQQTWIKVERLDLKTLERVEVNALHHQKSSFEKELASQRFDSLFFAK